MELGVPLEKVRGVFHQVRTRPVPLGPSYLCELIDVHGEPVLVLDLPRRLGLAHRASIEERKLVVVECGAQKLALCVDDVRDPEEVPRDRVLAPTDLPGSQHGPLKDSLVAVVRMARGAISIIEPRALASAGTLRKLSAALRAEGAAR
jgi:chemotaxis signal transduction protein